MNSFSCYGDGHPSVGAFPGLRPRHLRKEPEPEVGSSLGAPSQSWTEQFALLRPPARCQLYRFFFGGEGSLSKIEDRKNGTLVPTSPLEDLV